MDLERSDRLKQLPPYLFADLRRKMKAAKAKGVNVIRIDIGDPDQPAPDPVVAELCRAVADPDDADRHRYGCDRPVEAFPASARDFYKRRFGVTLAEDQLLTTMGSKDAIVKFCLALMNPGDLAIAPEPGYPTYHIGHVFAGGETFRVPLLPANDFLVDFDAIPADVAKRARLLWLNYPNNPTSATADLKFFARAIEFGRANDILIIHDAAYTLNTFEGYEAPSILQVDGADDVAVEFFSLSKAFSMTGWRAGFVAGNASAIAALNAVKENIDNGILRGIQSASATALDQAETLLPAVNAIYQRRRDLVVDRLNGHGFNVTKPKATIYIWTPVPAKFAGDSGAFATELLDTTGVMVTPGRGYGEPGEGFFRISLSYPDDVLTDAMDRIAELSL